MNLMFNGAILVSIVSIWESRQESKIRHKAIIIF